MPSWVQTSSPASLAISLSELKAQLRVTYNDEDALLLMYANAAVNLFEARTGRALINRTVRAEYEEFCDSGIKLPLTPVASVQSVQYYSDTGDTASTWDSSAYYTDTTSIRPKIVRKANEAFPFTEVRPNAVIVNFTAGYGDTYTAVPEGIRLGVMALASHFFTHRLPVIAGGGAAMEIPLTLQFIVDMYRVWEA